MICWAMYGNGVQKSFKIDDLGFRIARNEIAGNDEIEQ